jgi:ornithine cyclodeaminase
MSPQWGLTQSIRIDPHALARVDLYVPDSTNQPRKLGELRHAIAAGLISHEAKFSELGQIVAGQREGRQDDAQITLADLTGTGVQDTAIATLAFARAEAPKIGTVFSSDAT